MAVVEFTFAPSRWAKLAVTALTSQADVDAVFGSVDTTGWVQTPTWDGVAQVVKWQVIPSPFGPLFTLGVGSTIAVERPYNYGVARGPSSSAQIVTYGPGEWSDTAVTYL